MTTTIGLLYSLIAVLAFWLFYRQMGWHIDRAEYTLPDRIMPDGTVRPAAGMFFLEAISNRKKRRAVARFVQQTGALPTPRQIRALK